MASWALFAASGLYMLASYDYAAKGDVGMSLAFFAYSVANWGFILAARGV